MNYKVVNFLDFEEHWQSLLQSHQEDYLSMSMGGADAFISLPDGMNEEELDETCGVQVITTHHNGGVIIGFTDGITLFAFTSRDNNPHWENTLVDYLVSRGLNAEIVGNDVLVDGYKVAGFMDKWIDTNMQYFGIHISINVDLDIIRQICTKPMAKVPKGLSEYGITRAEVLEALGVDGD